MKTAIATIMLCTVAAGALLATGQVLPKIQPEEPQRVLCDDIAEELNLWYQDGQIGREEADRIIGRCYRLYGDT